MAKGFLRGNREKKKPKQVKEVAPVKASIFAAPPGMSTGIKRKSK